MTFEEWWNTKDYPDCCLLRCKRAFNEGRTELEKENAELKAKNKWYSEQVCNKECAEVWGNLTKAKDHIKTLLDCLKQDTNDPQTNYYVCQYMDKAEQFLKEIEK